MEGLEFLNKCTLPVFTYWEDSDFDQNAIVSVIACSGGRSFLENVSSIEIFQGIFYSPHYLTRKKSAVSRRSESLRFTMTFHSMNVLSDGVKKKLWEIAYSRNCDHETDLWNKYGSFGDLSLDSPNFGTRRRSYSY